MPRSSRIVLPGVPHHVTQRGSRRMRIFFSTEDFQRYRDLLAKGCRTAGVTVLAYCMMHNHVHLVLVPSSPDGLRRALAGPHQQYAWLINRREGWQGHIWQERFHSFPMDDAHLLSALRYVELNPVRAGLVATPEAWPWSSASAHIAKRSDGLVGAERSGILAAISDWAAFLAEGLDDGAILQHRQHQISGLPLATPDILSSVAASTGRIVAPRPRGRPPLVSSGERLTQGMSAAGRS